MTKIKYNVSLQRPAEDHSQEDKQATALDHLDPQHHLAWHWHNYLWTRRREWSPRDDHRRRTFADVHLLAVDWMDLEHLVGFPDIQEV